MARSFVYVVLVIVLCGPKSADVLAQSTAQMSGTVRDQTGAVLPGVEVTATQTETGLSRTVLTDETGSYAVQSLPVGPYRLEAALPGFRTYVQSGIILQVGANPVINAVLEVGQVSDQVEVQADAALVETRSTGVGQMIDNTRVLELPLNGRQVTELILLSGVANTTTQGSLSRRDNVYATTTITVAGGMSTGLTYMLDGGTHNDPFNNLNLPMPFPDALQEFKLETSAVPAQYGQHSAGAVNAVTKSGTNEFHGSLFEFVRNGAMNARNAFALTDDGLKRNQFGGTFGGPIVRNKMFFFGGYQGTTERSRPSTNQDWVATPAMLAGDFTSITSPACNSGRQINLASPFVNNRIDPRSFHPISLQILKYLPTTADPCGLVQNSDSRNARNERVFLGKVDYQLSEKHSIFGRFMGADQKIPTDFDGKGMLTLSVSDTSNKAYSLVVGDTYLFASGIVSSFRATGFRTSTSKFPPELFDPWADLGLNNIYQPYKKLPQVAVAPNGFSLPGGTVWPGHYKSVGVQLSEDLSLVKSAHQIGFGGQYLHHLLNGSSANGSSPTHNFSGAFTGLAMADFMVGRLVQFSQNGRIDLDPRGSYLAVYVQDTWKANSRFTINAGLRWEPYLSPYSGQGRTTHFSESLFDQGFRTKAFKFAPIGLAFPGDPGIPDKKYHNDAWLHFAPRLGLAWDPQGDGLMTVRAAYGIFSDFQHLWLYYGPAAATPYAYSVTLTNPPSFTDPWQGYPGGNPFPFSVTPELKFPTFGGYSIFPTDTKSTYVHQWNLSIQKQLGQDWLIAGNYLGNSTIHLWTGIDQNPVIFGPGATAGNANQRRLLSRKNPAEGQYYGAVGQYEPGGTAQYNAMLLSVQRRRSNGVTVQGNYTWSHCIGDAMSQMGPGNLHPDYRRWARGSCAGDTRHVVNASTVVETPEFSNAALRVLASGWQISGIVRLQSGNYFAVQSGVDTALVGNRNGQQANQILANPYHPDKNLDHWLNPAAFTRPANGEWGNSANNIQGPGSITINVGLTRTFNIRENQSLQFRAEAFNLPNHLNPTADTTANTPPFTTLTSPTFGRLTSAGDPRIMQLALKYVF